MDGRHLCEGRISAGDLPGGALKGGIPVRFGEGPSAIDRGRVLHPTQLHALGAPYLAGAPEPWCSGQSRASAALDGELAMFCILHPGAQIGRKQAPSTEWHRARRSSSVDRWPLKTRVVRGERLHSESNLERPRRRLTAATSKLPLIAIVHSVLDCGRMKRG